MLRSLRPEGRGRKRGNNLTTAMHCGVRHTAIFSRREAADPNAANSPMVRQTVPMTAACSSAGVESSGIRRCGMVIAITGLTSISMTASTANSMPTTRLLGLWEM